MKLCALVLDQNGRSMMTETEVPLVQVSDTVWRSEKQGAKTWSLAIRPPGEPFDGGPTEMHLTNFPALVLCLQGHLQTTGQDGQTCRLSAGEGVCIDGRALHHTSYGPGIETTIHLNMILDGAGSSEFK